MPIVETFLYVGPIEQPIIRKGLEYYERMRGRVWDIGRDGGISEDREDEIQGFGENV